MTESLADRIWAHAIEYGYDCADLMRECVEVRALEVLAKMRPMKDADQEAEINKLKAQLAKYQYTPQAYDEMWARVREVVDENDELKAQLEDCTAVNAEMKLDIARRFTSLKIN